MNETDKLIAEQLKTLPPNLRQAIDAVPWKALVQEIGKTNSFNAEQIASLEQETMFVTYGFENPNDYPSNMVREVGISEDIAYTIAESVTNKIFEPILKKSEELEKASMPKATPDIHPMVEPGETVHSVPHVEPPKAPLPDYRYEGSKDPYREPTK